GPDTRFPPEALPSSAAPAPTEKPSAWHFARPGKRRSRCKCASCRRVSTIRSSSTGKASRQLVPIGAFQQPLKTNIEIEQSRDSTESVLAEPLQAAKQARPERPPARLRLRLRNVIPKTQGAAD